MTPGFLVFCNTNIVKKPKEENSVENYRIFNMATGDGQ
jgi:hypothetical protein